jgi:hypothetical protein
LPRFAGVKTSDTNREFIIALFQGGEGQMSRVALTFILAIFGAFAMLFMGKYPQNIFKLVVAVNR